MGKTTEPFVKRAVRRFLDTKGYMEVDSREMHETGLDLIMRGRKNGRYILLEAKGETGAQSEMENKIIHAIGQIVTKFRKHPNYIHALAFPYGWRRRVATKINHDAMRVLNMRIYLVKENGAVIEITRSRRDLLEE